MMVNRAIGIGLMAVVVMMAMVPAVSAWAGIDQRTPSSYIQEVDVGASVYTSIFVKNYGAQDLIGVQIWSEATGEICYIYDYELGYFETIGCSGTFTMPDETVKLYFRALRAEGGQWVVDDVEGLILTPASPPTPVCTAFEIECRTGYNLAQCHYDGSNWDFYQLCTYGCTIGASTCNPAPTPTPSPQVCTPHEIECFGNRELWQCTSDGSGFQFKESCSYGCVAGSTQCNPMPTQTPTPTPTPTVTPTGTPTPIPTPDPGTCIANYEKRCFGDYLKTCNSAGDGWDETKTELCQWGCDAEKEECAKLLPGFEVVFAITGLLAVGYLIRRRGK